MSDDKFKLPNIPALHVPQYIILQDQPIQTTTNARSEEPVPVRKTDDDAAAVLVPGFPKLCPACSASLLQFLRPLQLYINQLVTVTSGMADQCEHTHIISKIQELPEILNLSQPPPGRTAKGQQQRETDVRQEYQQPQHQHQGQEGHVRNQEQRHPGSGNVPYAHVNSNSGDRREQLQNHVQRPETHQDPRTEAVASNNKPQVESVVKSQHTSARHKEDHIHRHEDISSQAQGGQRSGGQQSHQERLAEHQEKPEVRRDDSPQPARGQSAQSEASAGRVHQHEVRSPESTNAQVEDFEQVPDVGSTPAYDESGPDSDPEQRPFAFVTIVYDNLSAINAIILCNSLTLSCTKQVRHNGQLVQIPFVALITGHVDPVLKDFLPTVFDEVRETGGSLPSAPCLIVFCLPLITITNLRCSSRVAMHGCLCSWTSLLA